MRHQRRHEPHSPERSVFITDNLQISTSFTLWILDQKCAQRKLEFSHVACQLQLSALPEGLSNGSVQDECLDDILDNGNNPNSHDTSVPRNSVEIDKVANQARPASPMVNLLKISFLTKDSFSTRSFMYKLGPPMPAIGSTAFPKSIRCNLAIVPARSRRIAVARGSTMRSYALCTFYNNDISILAKVRMDDGDT